ncbi:LysR family transcriptional regulator [Nitrincola sp. MINF-07-Sa-05]|uniref:LysR family transcriptional regulator n=1 Tax=Nitrincola salilacus TaxID=3400273 RepID=UPI0039181DC7
MDSATLTAFVSVADCHSFSEAANRLFLTQSAISKRVAQLESQLSCRLFDRIGRHVSLTEAGIQLLPKAREILQSLEDAQRLVSNLSGRVSGKLSVAASHHISLHRLPPILKDYIQRYPEVELDLKFDESELAYESVLRGDLELALITLSPHHDERICAEVIWKDRLQYVVSSQHPLANSAAISLQQLNCHPAILPRSSTFTHTLVRQQLAEHGLEPQTGMSTNYLDTLRMMVRIGLGWSLLPETMIDEELVCLDVQSAPVYRDLGFIHHRDRTLSNAAREMVSLLQQQRCSNNQ